MADAPPNALDDTATVTKNTALQTAGNVLANDTDPENDPLSVAAVNGQPANVGTTIIGIYGSLVLGADGNYTYVLNNNNAAVQALQPGQTLTDSFQYTLSDGQTHTTPTTVTTTNLITQSEAFNNSAWVAFAQSGSAPTVTANVAAGPNGGAATADQIVLNGTNRGLYYLANVSGQYTFSIWARSTAGDGHFALNYYNGASNSSIEQVFTATSAWQQFTFTFNGVNNANSNVAFIHDATQSASGTFQLWGAQLNSGPTAGPYAATSGSTASVTTTIDTPVVKTANLTVTISGGAVDQPPVAVNDIGSVTKNTVLQATGNVLTNDSDPENDPLSVSAVNGQTASVGTTISGTYGALTLGANGLYTYTLNNNQANVQALAAGQGVTDVFQYTLSDGQTHSTSTTVTNTNLITQSEAFNSSPWVRFASSGSLPTITANAAAGPNGGASTADQIVLSTANRGVYYQSAMTGQNTFSVWVKLVSGNGNFDLNYFDGSASHATAFVATSSWQRVSITFSGNGNANDNVAFMHDASQSTSGTFLLWGAQLNPGAAPNTYVATAGSPQSVTTTTTTPIVVNGALTITVNGTSVNGPPVAVNDSAGVTKNTLLTATGNVTSNDSDPDSDALSVTTVNGQAANVGATISGTYGSITIGANGGYTYTLNNNQANVQALTPGQTVSDIFQYTISDGNGHSAGANLTVAVSGGINSAPVAVNDAAGVTKDGVLSATGSVLTNDSDPDNDALTVSTVNGQAAKVGAAVAGTYGSITIGAGGSYTYTLNNNQANVQALKSGQSATDTFQYTISDGNGHTATANVNVTVTGANTTPVAVNDTAAVTKNTLLTASGSVLTNDSDPDGDSLTVAAVNGQAANVGATIAGTYGTLTLGSNGNYTYTLNNNQANVQALAPGQTVTDTFQYTLSDGRTHPTTPGATLTVSISGGSTGPNQVPVAIDDSGAVTKNTALTTTGNVLSNDSDPDHDPLAVVAINGQAANVGATITGTYGTLVVGADGSFTYTLSNNQANVQALQAGQSGIDTFQYTLSDGQTHTTTQTVTNTNLITQSEAFNNAVWVKFNESGGSKPTVTANVAAGPNGGSATADQIVLNGTERGIYYATNVSGQYTFSIWVKMTSGDGHFALNYYNGASDTSTEQVFTATNTWQQYTFTFNGTNNQYSNIAFIHDGNQSASGTFQLWGAELNAGATPNAYVPTAGSVGTSTTTVTVPVVVNGNLAITVNGAGGALNSLSFAGQAAGIVANLATDQWTNTLKVMPLGDSITYGWTQTDYDIGQTNQSEGWRGPLWWSLAHNNMLVDFVGPNTSGLSDLADQSHAGYPGYRSDQIAALVPNLLSASHPDAVLLMMGTNDIFQRTGTTQFQNSLNSIINAVNSSNPATHLFVELIMPINAAFDANPNPQQDAQAVATYNSIITSTVNAANAAGKNVSIIDTSAMTIDDLFGAAHPTPAGYVKLAQILYNGLLAGEPNVAGTPGGTAHTIASNIVSVIGSENNDLLIAGPTGSQLIGGGGNDRLVSNGGNDVLTGGTGADQFVFSSNAAHTQVTDFVQGTDHLEFDGIQGLTSFSALSSHMSVIGGSLVIDLSSFGTQGQITLLNFAGTLNSNDVWFG